MMSDTQSECERHKKKVRAVVHHYRRIKGAMFRLTLLSLVLLFSVEWITCQNDPIRPEKEQQKITQVVKFLLIFFYFATN